MLGSRPEFFTRVLHRSESLDMAEAAYLDNKLLGITYVWVRLMA